MTIRTVQDLALATGISTQNVRDWLTGNVDAALDSIDASIRDALGIDDDDSVYDAIVARGATEEEACRLLHDTHRDDGRVACSDCHAIY